MDSAHGRDLGGQVGDSVMPGQVKEILKTVEGVKMKGKFVPVILIKAPPAELKGVTGLTVVMTGDGYENRAAAAALCCPPTLTTTV